MSDIKTIAVNDDSLKENLNSCGIGKKVTVNLLPESPTSQRIPDLVILNHRGRLRERLRSIDSA